MGAEGGAVCRRVIVHGRVQGVFFRDTTRKEAESRGVAGSVRNRDDGSVEAVFEGDREEVEAMVEFCRSGPSRADVDSLDVSDCEPSGASGFSVEG